MARDIDPIDQTRIKNAIWAHAELWRFDIPGHQCGIWPGNLGTITVGGLPYVGSGSVLNFVRLTDNVDQSATPIAIRLRAVPAESADPGDTPPDIHGITPDVLASIDNYPYKNALVECFKAFFDPDSGMLVRTITFWEGYIDTIEHMKDGNGEYDLEIHLEPSSIDNSREDTSTHSDAAFRALDPLDGFMTHAATVGIEKLPFMRASAITPTAARGPSG